MIPLRFFITVYKGAGDGSTNNWLGMGPLIIVAFFHGVCISVLASVTDLRTSFLPSLCVWESEKHFQAFIVSVLESGQMRPLIGCCLSEAVLPIQST